MMAALQKHLLPTLQARGTMARSAAVTVARFELFAASRGGVIRCAPIKQQSCAAKTSTALVVPGGQ